LKDVPDLIGPHGGLCPECYGIAAEELIPSLLKDWQSGGEDLDEEAPWESLDRAWDWDELDIFGDAGLACPLTHMGPLTDMGWLWEEEDDFPPPFHGRRRF
jgi:hypothetical protein